MFRPPGAHDCHCCALSHVTYCHLVAFHIHTFIAGSISSLMYYLGLLRIVLRLKIVPHTLHKIIVPCLGTSALNNIIFLFQALLRTKDNEVQFLKKEISCLQSEVQSLTKVYQHIFLHTALKFIFEFPVF